MSNTTLLNITDPTPMVTPFEYRNLALQAVIDSGNADKAKSSAVQTIAYAIMMHHADTIANGDKVPTYAAMLSSAKAMNEYVNSIMVWLYDEPIKFARGDDKFDARETRQARETQKACVKRATKMACDLGVHDIEPSAYKAIALANGRKPRAKSPLMAFHVPFAMLLGANDKATGEFTEATIVPLDNDDYPYMNGKKLLTLLASVNRLSTAADSRMGIVKPAKSIIPPPLPIPSADDATGIRADGSLTNSQGAENSTEAKTRDLTGDVQHLAKVIRDTKGDEVGAAWVQDNLDAILILKAEIVDWLYAIDVNNPANQSIAA